MTLKNCITGKAQRGLVPQGDAARVAELFDGLSAEARGRGAANPDAEAGLAVRDAEARRREARKRGALQAMKAQLDAGARLTDAARAGEDPMEAALSILDPDPRRKITGESVEGTASSVRNMALARMTDLVEQQGSKAAGLDDASPRVRERKRAGERALVKALFGEATGDANAEAVARGAADAMEMLRRLFNGAGGSIPKRADWGLPQQWSRRLVNTVTAEQWVDEMMGELDLARMIDAETGQPFVETKLRRVLGEIYADIVTDGLRDVTPQGFVSRGNIAVKRAQARFLVFKDADAWMRMQARYGEGTAFETILSHVNGMARDIAVMRHLGPTPDATLRFLERRAGELKGEAALGETGRRGARAAARIAQGRPKLRDLYATVTGQIYAPANESWANGLAGNRNLVASAMLGGAIFSAVSDQTLMLVTARLNGLAPARAMGRALALFNPASGTDRRAAARAGFVNETALGTVVGASRYIGELMGPAWTRKVADVVLRATGLTPWTNLNRTAFGLEFLGALTEHARFTWEGLRSQEAGKLLRRSLEAYGVTQADWDLFRSTPAWRDPETGATFIRMNDVIGEAAEEGGLFQARFEAANRINQAILGETDLAIPTVSKRALAITTLGAQPGTIAGEIGRNTFLFKSFPVTMAVTHLRRMVFGNLTPGEKAQYAAFLLIGTAVLGTLGEQLSQITKGHDPLPLDERETWAKGFARGGGLGIFGDFVFNSENRFGGSLADTLAGPVFGSELPDLANLTFGNLMQLARGEDTKAGRELVRFARRMTPGRSAWQISTALDLYVFDQLQRLLDPGAERSFRARERFFEREFGQTFWARPGRGTPERGPDLGRLIGE